MAESVRIMLIFLQNKELITRFNIRTRRFARSKNLHVKVAPYGFITARALMMRTSVICARSFENVGFS